MKKKVLVVGSFNALSLGVVGGIARSCEELMDSIFVNQFDVITLDSTQKTNPPPSLFYRSFYAFKRILIYIYLIIFKRPEAVLLFFSSGASFYEKCIMGWIAKIFKIQVILFPRAGALMTNLKSKSIFSILGKKLLNCGDLFLAQGPSWYRFANEIVGFSAENISIIPNWTSNTFRQNLGLEKINKIESTFKKNTIPVVLFVGWLEPGKGVQELIQAFDILNKNGIIFKLKIAGHGSQFDMIQSFIKENNLGKQIDLLGWVRGDDLEKLYLSSDIFVLPSWNEGMPNALIESMSYGLCPVVTNVGMIPDFIKHDENGKIVTPKCTETLYKCMNDVIVDQALRLRLAKEANTSSQVFNKDQIIPRLCQVIENKLRNAKESK